MPAVLRANSVRSLLPLDERRGQNFLIQRCDLVHLERLDQFICLDTGNLLLEPLLQAGIMLGEKMGPRKEMRGSLILSPLPPWAHLPPMTSKVPT